MIRWNVVSEPELESPVLVEGLPGIGNVGKVAAEYMIEKLEAEKFAELYSDAFPYHVFVNEDDTVDMPRIELFFSRDPEMVIITGDVQPLTPEGHYELAGELVDYLKKFDVGLYVTLGGFGVKELPLSPRVLGAVTDGSLKEKYADAGLSFESGERVGIIIGASGLLLGFAKLEGIEGLCLMGETLSRPMFTDSKAAKAVLQVLCKVVGLSLDMKEIEERSQELEKAVTKAKEIEKRMIDRMSKPAAENLRYIG